MKKMKFSQKKVMGLLGVLSLIIMLISTVLITTTFLKYTGVKSILVLGYIGIAIFIALFFGAIFLCLHFFQKKIVWPKILIIISIILISGVEFYGNTVLTRMHDALAGANKATVIYSTSLITLAKTEYKGIQDIKNLQIGIVQDESSIDGYKISMTIVNENNLKDTNELVSYEDFPSLIKALYDEEVDAIFIPTEYYKSFADAKEEDNPYKNILEDTREITYDTEEVAKEPTSNVVDFAIDEPFTILLMGIDNVSTDIKTSNANGDSLMLITFNPNTLNATILSIPRDTYVPITCLNNKENKITHAGWYGQTCMQETIENFTGIEIDHYVKVDFKALIDLVDKLGGIEVDVPYSFCESNSKRQWGENTVYVREGKQTLNGEQALAFARNRHPNPKHCSSEWTNYTGNDFVRGQHQQTIIKAILQKIKKIRSIDTVLELLETIESHMDTSFTTDQILSFYDIGIAVLQASASGSEPVEMQRLYLNGYDRYIYEPSLGLALYNYVYYSGSLDEIVHEMKVNLELAEPIPTTEFTYSINEPYEQKVIGKDNTYTDNMIYVLPNFVGSSKEEVLAWANMRNVNVTFTTIDSSSSEHIQDEVMAQSYPMGTKLTNIPSEGVNFTVVNKITFETPSEEPEIDCNLEENKNLPICQVITDPSTTPDEETTPTQPEPEENPESNE